MTRDRITPIRAAVPVRTASRRPRRAHREAVRDDMAPAYAQRSPPPRGVGRQTRGSQPALPWGVRFRLPPRAPGPARATERAGRLPSELGAVQAPEGPVLHPVPARGARP